MPKVLRTAALFVSLSVVVLAAGGGDFRPSPLDLAVSPYKYSLLQWELSNFLDKWVRQAGLLLPWASENDRSVKNKLAQEFFELGRRHAHRDILVAAVRIASAIARSFVGTNAKGMLTELPQPDPAIRY